MKKPNEPKKTRLHVERETLRMLQVHELRGVDGGDTTIIIREPPLTSDSEKVCCA